MKKILFTLLTAGFLTISSQVMAASTSVDMMEEGTYFHGPFSGAQMWVLDRIAFRDHISFDSQAYMKFDVDSALSGVPAADILSATFTFHTVHVNEDIANMIWGSPLDGQVVDIEVSAYAGAVNTNLVVEPAVVSGSAVVKEDHIVRGGVVGSDPSGMYLDTIEIDVTSIVQAWANNDYDNHGFRLDIKGIDPGNKFYMWAFTSEEGMVSGSSYDVFYDYGLNPAGLNVEVVPVPAAVFLLASGIIGIVGLRRRKK